MKHLLISCLLLSAAGTLQAVPKSNIPPLKLWYNKPATAFEESLPIGNGKLGALIYGGANNDSIYLNDITLWTGKPVNREEGGDAYKWIPKIREALFKEDYKAADSLQLHVQGHNSEYYQPLAIINIKDANKGQFSNYKRELSLDNATAALSYTRGGIQYQREYFASHPDKMIAIHLTATQKKAINCDISLTSLIPHQVKASNKQLTITGHAMGKPENSTHFCSILSIKNQDGTITASDSILHLQGVSEAVIYLVNETSYNGFDKHPVKEGAPYIEKVNDNAWHLVNYTYPELKQRHITDFRTSSTVPSLHSREQSSTTSEPPTSNSLITLRKKSKTLTWKCSISNMEDIFLSAVRELQAFLPISRDFGLRHENLLGVETTPSTSTWKKTIGQQR